MSRTHEPIPADFEVQPVPLGTKGEDIATDGYCGLSWDDSIVTDYTPAPSARCPFEGFHIYEQAIDLGTYERQRDRLREELTLIEIDRHGSKLEEFDVEGILNFAERVLPRAADLWIQASLEQRQRLQRLFFPEGVAFGGKAFDRTVVTSSLFEYLRPIEVSNEDLVDQTVASWNQVKTWLERVVALS